MIKNNYNHDRLKYFTLVNQVNTNRMILCSRLPDEPNILFSSLAAPEFSGFGLERQILANFGFTFAIETLLLSKT